MGPTQAPPAPTQTPPTPTPPVTSPPQPGPEGPVQPPIPPQQTATKDKKGYGKRPVWQWVLIYVVAAIIVYGIVYFVWIHKGSSTGSGGY